jgi:7,8-dihydropterin-6-yl-methyl-4-(beta-D-ribofuranosyl)aminobenzene 5'-phosphate synthase
MKVAIIYDNTAKKGFQSGWGFSCLVDQKILFDTGEAPDPLFYNMEILKVDISNLEAVVISHDHWDHTGGLWGLLQKRKGLKVYACPGFSPVFKDKVHQLQGKRVETETYQEIAQNIIVTGEIPGEYGGAYMPEQALVVKTERGITIITGCSHPGIVTIIQKVRELFSQERISLVLGGFHLMDKDKKMIETIVASMKEFGVENVGPTHCTGQEAQYLFKNSYADHFLSIMAGQTLEI